MAETPEQQALLQQIEQETATLQLYQTKLKDTRNKLWELMVAAKDLHTSSYSISRAAGISQPRVMQVIKEVKLGPEAPKQPSTKGLSQKKLLEQVALLQQELHQARQQLATQETKDAQSPPVEEPTPTPLPAAVPDNGDTGTDPSGPGSAVAFSE